MKNDLTRDEPISQQPAPGAAALEDFPAEPQTGFSLRFLIGVSICFALVFAVAGIVGRDWNQTQLTVFACFFLGGNALGALLLYAALYARRRLSRTFGRLLHQSPLPSMPAWLIQPRVLYSLATVCFAAFGGVCLATAHGSRDGLEFPAFGSFYGMLAGLQVTFVRLAISRPGALEIYERGLVIYRQGKFPWEQFLKVRWADTQPDSLVMLINKKGSGNHTLTFKVPQADCDRVGAILHAALGDRFNDARIPSQAEA